MTMDIGMDFSFVLVCILYCHCDEDRKRKFPKPRLLTEWGWEEGGTSIQRWQVEHWVQSPVPPETFLKQQQRRYSGEDTNLQDEENRSDDGNKKIGSWRANVSLVTDATELKKWSHKPQMGTAKSSLPAQELMTFGTY